MRGCKAAAVLCVALAMLSQGCVRKPAPGRPEAVSFIDAKLKDAAESISHDMASLAGSTQMRDMRSEKGSGGLYSRMDITWDGPLEGALRRIASTAGYRVQIEGKPPKEQPVIHLKLMDRPCLAALREAGLQTGKGEGVIVDEASRLITLKYLGE